MPADRPVASAARMDPAHYTPSGMPAHMRCYLPHAGPGLGVGAAGKVGLLELELAPVAGTTRVKRQYCQAPLYLYRPIHLDPGRPDMAFVYLQQSGDGLVQGDRYRLDITCAPDGAAHITTQTPTKVFRSSHGITTQVINLSVAERAIVEYLPDPIVPCRGSRLFQRTTLTIDPTATVIWGEALLPGRVAHNEWHAYDDFWAETQVQRPDGSMLFTDQLRLQPATDPASLTLLGGHDVIGTLYVVTDAARPTDLVTSLRAALPVADGLAIGVSELPNDCGVSVRVFARSSAQVQTAMRDAWDVARRATLGLPAPELRKS